jgi:hypothetical protein
MDRSLQQKKDRRKTSKVRRKEGKKQG